MIIVNIILICKNILICVIMEGIYLYELLRNIYENSMSKMRSNFSV